MNIASNISPSNKRETRSGILARVAQVLSVFIVESIILFLGAGQFGWTWAWVFLGIYLATMLTIGTTLVRKNPEMMAERGRAPLTQTWDKWLSGIFGLAEYLLLPLVAALDVRFAWSGELALAWHITGAAVFALGMALFVWAMVTNAYFSTAVRIQSERGHVVCTSGPYRIVRHPGYLGLWLQSLGIPLLLGSWWALIPAVVAIAAITGRTFYEDRTLQAGLPGYAEFVMKTRYRLIPGVW